MIAALLFFRPTIFKFMLMAALVAAGLLLDFSTRSPFEGSVREGPVSGLMKFGRTVGRTVAFTGVYRAIARRSARYFQPDGPWEEGRGFIENPTIGARFLKKRLPRMSWEWPGRALGLGLGVLYYHFLACVAARLLRP